MCYRILKDALMRKHYTLQSYAIERLEEKIRQKQRKDDDFEPKEPKHKQPSELLTTEEAAAYLKLKPNTLERWCSQYPHRLPPKRSVKTELLSPSIISLFMRLERFNKWFLK